jgi:hypothetical protein
MLISRTHQSKLEPILNCTHFWVNHSKTYVNEYDNSIHVNNIERTWRSFCKCIGHLKRRIVEEKVDLEIANFLFRSNTLRKMQLDLLFEIIRNYYY